MTDEGSHGPGPTGGSPFAVRVPGRRLGPAEAWRRRRAVARAGLAGPDAGPGVDPGAEREALRRALEEARGADGEAGGGPIGASATLEGEGPGRAAPAERPRDASGASGAGSSPALPDRTPQASAAIDSAWEALPALRLDPRHLARQLVIAAARTDPAHGAFDVLRARILAEMAARGWRRLGITSPTKGCGKTFTAANLALSLARLGAASGPGGAAQGTLLLDLDMRQPALARVLGLARPGALGDWLRGAVPAGAALGRVGPNPFGVGRLALGLNGRREPYAAELVREPGTARALAEAEALLAPAITLVDLPPALAQDDVLAMRPHLDALLLVAGGGQTTPRELREAARRLGRDAPILGVVLNKAEGEEVSDYAYAYD